MIEREVTKVKFENGNMIVALCNVEDVKEIREYSMNIVGKSLEEIQEANKIKMEKHNVIKEDEKYIMKRVRLYLRKNKERNGMSKRMNSWGYRIVAADKTKTRKFMENAEKVQNEENENKEKEVVKKKNIFVRIKDFVVGIFKKVFGFFTGLFKKKEKEQEIEKVQEAEAVGFCYC